MGRLLGQLLLGDIDDEPVPEARLAGFAPHQHSMVTEPYHAAVLGDAPILHAPRVPGELDPPVLGQHPLTVVGVQDLLPEPRLSGLLGRVAYDLLEPWAFVQPGAAERVDLGVDNRGA